MLHKIYTRLPCVCIFDFNIELFVKKYLLFFFAWLIFKKYLIYLLFRLIYKLRTTTIDFFVKTKRVLYWVSLMFNEQLRDHYACENVLMSINCTWLFRLMSSSALSKCATCTRANSKRVRMTLQIIKLVFQSKYCPNIINQNLLLTRQR